MIGEAEDCAIGTLDAPAPCQRGGAVVEMGLQASGEGFHSGVIRFHKNGWRGPDFQGASGLICKAHVFT
jgi:hypothetical protein